MKCSEAFELMSLYYDKEIDKASEAGLFEHMKDCSGCLREFEELGRLMSDISEIPLEPLPKGYHEELMLKLEAVKPDKSIYAAAEKSQRKERRRYSRIDYRRWAGTAAALAAVILAGAGMRAVYYSGKMASENSASYESSTEEIYSGGYEDMTAPQADMIREDSGGSGASKYTRSIDMDGGLHAEPEMYAVAEEAATEDGAAIDEPNTGGAEGLSGRKQIKNYYANLSVDDFDTAIAEIKKITSEKGGYVENFYSNSYYNDNNRKDGEITVRIPVESYNSVINGLQAIGRVENEGENTDDITTEYIDTEGRLKIKNTERDRVLALLEKSESIEDIIKLEERLSHINTEIESYETSIRNWDKLVQFCKVTLYVQQDMDVRIQPVSPTFAQQIKNGFRASVNSTVLFLQNFAVGIAYNWFAIAVCLIAAAAASFKIRKVIKRRGNERVSGNEKSDGENGMEE